jgi:hypothetical protein
MLTFEQWLEREWPRMARIEVSERNIKMVLKEAWDAAQKNPEAPPMPKIKFREWF